jgi:hypothetical protein
VLAVAHQARQRMAAGLRLPAGVYAARVAPLTPGEPDPEAIYLDDIVVTRPGLPFTPTERGRATAMAAHHAANLR